MRYIICSADGTIRANIQAPSQAAVELQLREDELLYLAGAECSFVDDRMHSVDVENNVLVPAKEDCVLERVVL